MDLSNFLETANADNALALAEAHAYTESRTKFVSEDTLNGLVAQLKVRVALKNEAKNDLSDVQDYADALIDSLSKPSDFNLDPTHPMGQGNIAMLDELIAADIQHKGKSISSQITALKTTLLALSVEQVNPFESATIEDVQAIRNPGVKTLCVHGDGTQDFVVSVRNKDSVLFVFTPLKDVESIEVMVEWRESVDHDWKEHDSIYIRGAAPGKPVSRARPRPPGLSSAKHFRFHFLTPEADMLASMEVQAGE